MYTPGKKINSDYVITIPSGQWVKDNTYCPSCGSKSGTYLCAWRNPDSTENTHEIKDILICVECHFQGVPACGFRANGMYSIESESLKQHAAGASYDTIERTATESFQKRQQVA
jgi:hypothetical protein